MGKYNKYEEEFKEKIIRLHLEEGRTKKSLTEEYSLGKGTLTYWLQQRREEVDKNQKTKAEMHSLELTRRVMKENAELKKENEFLKKAAAFFAKEID